MSSEGNGGSEDRGNSGSAKPGWMREQMPGVAAWIDELRRVFGRDEIDEQIRRGMRGEPTFHAYENGHEIGTPIAKPPPLLGPPTGRRRGSAPPLASEEAML